jgi:hypothetical protein
MDNRQQYYTMTPAGEKQFGVDPEACCLFV